MYHERIFTAKAADMITAIQNYKINCAGLLNICLCFLLQQNSRMALKKYVSDWLSAKQCVVEVVSDAS